MGIYDTVMSWLERLVGIDRCSVCDVKLARDERPACDEHMDEHLATSAW
jgi:hypothetical protein